MTLHMVCVAKPLHIKRLRIIIVMSVHALRDSANLARLLNKRSIPNCGLDSLMSDTLLRMISSPTRSSLGPVCGVSFAICVVPRTFLVAVLAGIFNRPLAVAMRTWV